MNGKPLNRSLWLLILMGLVCFSCSNKKSGDVKEFAKVGKKILTQDDFESFKKMKRFYPAYLGDFQFPGNRLNQTQCVETKAIYKKAGSVKGSVKSSADWKWKELFFPAQMYMMEILDKNLGSSDGEIESYYNANLEEYKKTIKVKIPKDSTAKVDSTAKDEYKDSVIYRPMNAVRSKIAQTLFVKNNPPDEEFYKTMITDTTKKTIDTSKAHDKYVAQIRKNVPDYFMKKLYKETYASEYPDSLNEIFGDGKAIAKQDLDVILGWLPEKSRERYQTPDKQRYLIEWLLKWKLFSAVASTKGLLKTKEYKDVLDWAWKYDVAIYYINDKIAKGVVDKIIIDTAMCVFEHWDRTGRPGVHPDSSALENIVSSNLNSKLKVAVDGEIFAIRKRAGIKFLQSDFVDDKNEDPDFLATKADSLYGAGNSKDAETIYKKLVDNYPFTKKGQNAHVELAKILTEKEKYIDAVKNYRRFLIFSDDKDRRCNIFFMIGFVYGEYRNKPELAEANYKWILKNTPDCELSDDAEFMCLHLNEPMIGVDELQAEAKRQGRKIEEESVN